MIFFARNSDGSTKSARKSQVKRRNICNFKEQFRISNGLSLNEPPKTRVFECRYAFFY